ncbi:hypothetical protein BJV78DRAFT_576204 [Lactifluus subvellereus]|nr:hypothetical protein BJV78DRAFT_576204 [Lactifluus subvellereus]
MYRNLRPIELGAERVVIILVGLIASGKVCPLLLLLSTFAEALQRYIPQIRRCNQDELGNRRRVEDLSRTCLRQGLSVCIDRTNLDSTQRSHWTGIAREFPGTAVWIIVFDTPYEVCAARLRMRRNHPTITDANHGMRILSRLASTLEPPQPVGRMCAISSGVCEIPRPCMSTPTVHKAQLNLPGTMWVAIAGAVTVAVVTRGVRVKARRGEPFLGETGTSRKG